MHLEPNLEQSSAAQVFTEILSRISQKSQTWEDLLAEDAVFESPYTPRTPKRFQGKAAACNFIKTALAQMQDLRFSNIQVYPTTNPNLLWAEFHGEAIAVATGRLYKQDYVLKLETREGQIVLYRDYGNPISVLEAWGSTQDLQEAFNPHNLEDAE